MPLLEGMDAINNKATKPGISIGEQLSPKDIDRFNQLRHLNIQLDVEKLRLSDFQRDAHVIYETYEVAELSDLYDTKIDNLGEADPRRFYFVVLQGLRIAQPRTTRTPLVNVGIECDPEAGLYFQEEFYQHELAKSGANQRTVNLIFDIERLRTLYQLNWNLFNKGIDDVRATNWNGDIPSTPDSVTPMIATSSAATQNIYKAIIPYIEKQFPSKIALQTRFMQTQVQQATRDYPAQKSPPTKAVTEGELNALRSKLISLWEPPAAVSKHPELYVVTIRIRLTRDHRLAGRPEVLTNGDGPLFEATRDSAVRAVYRAQPYDMLSLTTYDQWKEIDINFDPREVATPQDAGESTPRTHAPSAVAR